MDKIKSLIQLIPLLLLCTLACSPQKEKQKLIEIHDKQNPIIQNISPYQQSYLDNKIDKNAINTEIKQKFSTLQNAILNFDATIALPLISENTLKHYQNLLKLSEKYIQTQTNPLSDLTQDPATRLNITMIISFIPVKFLKKMTPEQLLSVAIQQGWLGLLTFKHSVINEDLQFNKDHITIKLTNNNDNLLPTIREPQINAIQEYDQIKKNYQWKFDLMPMIQLANDNLLLYADATGKTPQEFILSIVNDALKDPPIEQWKNYDAIIPNHVLSIKLPRKPIRIIADSLSQNTLLTKSYKYGDFYIHMTNFSKLLTKANDNQKDILVREIYKHLETNTQINTQKTETATHNNNKLTRFTFSTPDNQQGMTLFILTQNNFLIQLTHIHKNSPAELQAQKEFFDSAIFQSITAPLDPI